MAKNKNVCQSKKKAIHNQIKITKRSIYILCAALVLLLVFSGLIIFGKKAAAKDGDVVDVWYTLKLYDGTVKDSNVKEIIEANNLPPQENVPLEFMLGEGKMIRGFEKGIIGMRLGEKKTIEVGPGDAYGFYSADKVQVLERHHDIEQDTYYTLGIEILNGTPHKIGDIISLKDSPWEHMIVALNDSHVVIKPYINEGDEFNLTESKIMIIVKDIGDEKTIFDQVLLLEEGDIINTDNGVAKVIDTGKDFVKLDFNHDLAGKTLYFDLELVGINGKRS